MQVCQGVFAGAKAADEIVRVEGKMVFQDLSIPWIIFNYEYAIVFHTVDFVQIILPGIAFQVFGIKYHIVKCYRL